MDITKRKDQEAVLRMLSGIPWLERVATDVRQVLPEYTKQYWAAKELGRKLSLEGAVLFLQHTRGGR